VFMSATLALQPGVGAFMAPLRLVLRGTKPLGGEGRLA
jgi:hypothetical protein